MRWKPSSGDRVRRPFSTQGLMWLTVALLLPGALTQALVFGWGVLANLLIALPAAVLLDVLFRGRAAWQPQPTLHATLDGSAAIAGALIALALPAGVSPLLLLLAVGSALGIGKYAYGGLGNNPFNPAMVGYAIVLVSFAEPLAHWSTTALFAADSAAAVDALSGATPLDALAHRGSQTVAEFRASGAVGRFGGRGWEWINLAYLLGGCALIALRICHWRVPVAVLLGLTLCAIAGYDNGSSESLGSPLFHLFSGATCLTAFFIATDPVSQPSHPRAQWLFGLLIGGLLFAIRSFGAWPDGAAFAVLLANATGPWLQSLCVRRDRARALRTSAS